jgi:hypothetical protein
MRCLIFLMSVTKSHHLPQMIAPLQPFAPSTKNRMVFFRAVVHSFAELGFQHPSACRVATTGHSGC